MNTIISYLKNPKVATSSFSWLVFFISLILGALGAGQSTPVPLYVVGILVGGFYFVREAIEKLLEKKIGIELLMSVGIVGAAALGEWREALLLVGLYSISEAIESFITDKTRSAIEALMDLVPKLLEAMKTTQDFFFDILTQIQMPTWSKGRIVVVGDAAYCPTLMTGYGSQLAMVGAYILAGELKLASGDYKSAFQAYDKELRPFVEQKQGNTKLLGQLVPGSAFGLWARNHVMKLMANPAFTRFIVKMTYGQVVKEEITLKDYDNL